MGTLVPTEWVLLDIRVHSVVNGFGHGVVHLWAQDGTLLAMASQSTIVRFWTDEAARLGVAATPE
jgi:acyl-CoA thioesterase